MPREELEARQLAGIQRLVRHAYEHVPFYRLRYRAAGIHPEDVRTLQDVRSLPLLTKQDIREHLEELVTPGLRAQAQSVMTGASTGEPMKLYVEDSFWWWNAAYEWRGREWYGVREGDRIAWIWGALTDLNQRDLRERAKARLLQHRQLDAFGMSEDGMRRFAAMLGRWQPAMIRAYASMIDVFAGFLEENGISDIRPRLIETGAERLRPQQRELVEGVFASPIADCYVAREFGTIAYACPSGSLHVGETRYLELLGQDEPVPAGDVGRVVVTSLHQRLMPLIRYRIDDEAVLRSAPCSCGRELPALAEIRGRSNDYVRTADGRTVHDGYFAVYFWGKPEVARYQVYQPDLHHVQVRVVCSPPTDERWRSIVQRELSTKLGAGTEVEVVRVDDIERTTAGKLRFVVSEVVGSPD